MTAAMTTIRPTVTIKPSAAFRKAIASLNDLQIDFSSMTSEELDQIRAQAEALSRNAQGIVDRARTEWIEQVLA